MENIGCCGYHEDLASCTITALIPAAGGEVQCVFCFPSTRMEIILTPSGTCLEVKALEQTANGLADRVLAFLEDEDRINALLECANKPKATEQTKG